MFRMFESPDRKASNSSSHPAPTSNTAATSMHKEYEEADNTVYGGDVQMGSLTERILGALREEGVSINGNSSSDKRKRNRVEDDDDGEGGEGVSQKAVVSRTVHDMMSLEDRLRMEMRYLGLLDEKEVWISRSFIF
jgi:hypothetical protein